MNVYDKVQHVMIPTADISPQQEKWIGEVADLVAAFCADLGLETEGEQSMASFVLQITAETLWRESEGKPCWSQLDVHRFLGGFDKAAEGRSDHLRVCTVVTLVGFYGWLSNTNRLKHRQARRILAALEQRLPDCLIAAPAYGEA
jgi:hypothetical protein